VASPHCTRGCPKCGGACGSAAKEWGSLSVALFGHSRSDQRLLTVAERLASQAQVCFEGGEGHLKGEWRGKRGVLGGQPLLN
jgi:hypothetical protein